MFELISANTERTSARTVTDDDDDDERGTTLTSHVDFQIAQLT